MAKRIVLDPGHGGEDPGAVGFGLEEKSINLDIALKVREKLNNFAEVLITRSNDTFVSLSGRSAYSNKVVTDLFLSIHVNAGGGSGFESFVYTGAGGSTLSIRESIHKEMADFYKSKGFPDRGMKKANFAVLRETIAPAVLVENLFIDRREDADKLKLPAFRDEVAGAIARGVARALNIDMDVTPSPTEPPTQPTPHWAEADFNRLKKLGLVFNEHDLNSTVTWGEMSAVFGRLLDKLKT